MTSASRIPPHNIQAEESLLGAMLLSSLAIADAVGSGLSAADFYKLSHGYVFEVVVSLYSSGRAADPVTVDDELRRSGHENAGGANLVTLQANTPSIGNAGRYARIIEEHSRLRRLIRAAGEISEMAYDLPEDVGEAVDRSRELLAGIDGPGTTTDESVDVGTFVSGDDSYDWLVPWLIERGERVLVVAGEKAGKSMILRQIAVCCSFGLHPFGRAPFAPLRVLMLDLENPVNLIRRKVRPMVAQALAQRPSGDTTMMRVLCRPGGINLAKRSDSRWLAGQLAETKPDLVVAGPLYKMFRTSDKDWEAGAEAVTSVLDDLRTRMGFSLLVETHAPQEYGGKRNLRPIGSSIWLRWPEFILSFAALENYPHTIRLTTLAGRDERQWPPFLERGGQWPWTPCRDPEGTDPEFDQGEF